MNTKFPLASTAALIADPARAAMLTALLDRKPKSAGELAMVAGVSAQSASMHLAQLLAGGFLRVSAEGRHRYYRMARPEIAHAIESLGAISTVQKYRPAGASRELCYARTCYDHLAGELAIRLTDMMERKHFLRAKNEREYEITSDGEKFLSDWQINVGELRKSRRNFARRCLDWTERRDHLAGAVGAAICKKMIEVRWITRDKKSRAVHVTHAGQKELEGLLA
jgi:DNA-binding transcriptional ArsR family regulator